MGHTPSVAGAVHGSTRKDAARSRSSSAAGSSSAATAGIAYHRAMRLLLATALFVSACVAESAQGPGARARQPAADEITCKDEQPTGSAITRRVCRGPEQRQNDEAAKQSWMTGFHPNPMRGDFTYPGVDLRHPPPPPSTETTHVPPASHD